MIRKVDSLGRIVLPVEYRQALDIKGDDDVDIIFRQGCIIIKKAENEKERRPAPLLHILDLS